MPDVREMKLPENRNMSKPLDVTRYPEAETAFGGRKNQIPNSHPRYEPTTKPFSTGDFWVWTTSSSTV